MWVPSWGRKDSLEKKMENHSILLPGKPYGQRRLAGCSPRSCKESVTTEHSHANAPSSLGIQYQAQGTPLHGWDACLEHPVMDPGGLENPWLCGTFKAWEALLRPPATRLSCLHWLPCLENTRAFKNELACHTTEPVRLGVLCQQWLQKLSHFMPRILAQRTILFW